jgi:hypothetical protein
MLLAHEVLNLKRLMNILSSVNRLSAATVLIVAIGGGTVTARANLLTNGSFEDTTHFTDNSGNDTTVLYTGDTSMTDWTVVGPQLAWIGPSNPFGIYAPDGSYYLDLTSYSNYPPNWGGVEQTVSTEAGAQYQLSFELGSNLGSGDSAVIASATGTAGANYSNTPTTGNEWTPETYDFTATGTSTTIEIVGSEVDYTSFIGLDGVDLEETAPPPNPSVPDAAASAGLLALGLAALSLVGKRRTALV